MKAVIFYFRNLESTQILHRFIRPSDFMWEYNTGYQARKGLHTQTVKIDPHKFCHLIQPYNSYTFKIYQKH